MSDLFAVLVLFTPLAGILYLIYRHNFQGRRSLSPPEKLRGMVPWIGVFVGVPILLFALYMIFDIDTCIWRSQGCLAE